MSSFASLFHSALRSPGIQHRTPPQDTCRTPTGTLCSLCSAVTLDYDSEIQLKERVLREWWEEAVPGVTLAPLVRSPLARHYRSVSKRKAFKRGRRLMLGLIDPDADSGEHAIEVRRCAIEPLSHAAVYESVDSWLGRAVAGPFLETLQYVIVKGDDRERVVILNVRAINAGVVRAANALSKTLTAADESVRGFFLYEDASDGRYYLGTTSSGGPGRLQRLYGSATLSHRTAGKRFVYPVQSFSQVNQSMLDPLVEQVGGLLQLPVKGTLYDLYCGYGLFGIAFSERAGRVIGADIAPAAIEAAGRIVEHLKIGNAKFTRSNLTETSLASLMQRGGPGDVAILDPPRGGTASGVIEVVASRRCSRVVHLFCNIDILPEEVLRWKNAGYTFVQAVPLDLFPGTPTIEIAGLFIP
jgi:tRNA/tmRNA/rRNA uracil-C5-methylase (TrmA/RlmC/RlmD family)